MPLSRRPAVLTMLALIVVCVVGSLVMRSMNGWLNQTSLFYVGLPALLAALLVLSRPSTSAYGIVLKGTTLFLLIATIFAGEGVVCVLFAAPLVYAVALLVAALVNTVRKGGRGARVVAAPALLLAVASTEGAVPALTLPAENTVTAERVVAATPRPGAGRPRGAAALRRADGDARPGLSASARRPPGGSRPGRRAAHPLQRRAGARRAPARAPLGHGTVDPDAARGRGGRPVGGLRRGEGRHPDRDVARLARFDGALGAGRGRHPRRLVARLRPAPLPAKYWTPLERAVAQRAADYLIGSLALPA